MSDWKSRATAITEEVAPLEISSEMSVPSWKSRAIAVTEDNEAPESDISGIESFGRGGLQGASMGSADEVISAYKTLTGTDSNLEALASLPIAGVKVVGNLGSKLYDVATTDTTLEDLLGQLKGDYTKKRDDYRAADKAAQDANPMRYGAGLISGGVASSLIPGLNLAKGAQLGAMIKNGAMLGTMAGVGSSTADLTEGDIGGVVQDGVVGGLAGGAGASLFPALGGLVRPSKSFGQAVSQTLGTGAVGAGIGGALGLASNDIGTEDGRNQVLKNTMIGAGIGLGARPALGVARAIGNTGRAQDAAASFDRGLNRISIVGKESLNKISNQLDEYTSELADYAKEVLTGQKQGAVGKQLNLAKNMNDKIDATQKLVGEEIGKIYKNTKVESANFDEFLDGVQSYLKRDDLSIDERAYARDLAKQLDSLRVKKVTPSKVVQENYTDTFGAPGSRTVEIPEQVTTSWKPMTPKDYLNVRKELQKVAYSTDFKLPGQLRNTAKTAYEQLNKEGAEKLLDEETGKVILPLLNKQYALNKNVDDILGQGKYSVAEGASEAGTRANAYVKNLGEDVLTQNQLERTGTISNLLEEIDPKLLEETKFGAKQAGLAGRNADAAMSSADAAKLKASIPDLANYNSNVESMSEFQTLFNRLAETNAKKAKQFLDRGLDLSETSRLAGQVKKEGEKTVFSTTAAGIKALTSTNTYANLAGQALAPVADIARTLSKTAVGKGYASLAKSLETMSTKDVVGRNAMLFSIMQNPEQRQQYEELTKDQEQEEMPKSRFEFLNKKVQ